MDQMTDCQDCLAAPECYACMVGVWTGPESHSCCCPAGNGCGSTRGVAMALARTVTEHRIHTRDDEEDEERSIWECSCGSGGSAATHRVDIASDQHIPAGDTRIDTSRPF